MLLNKENGICRTHRTRKKMHRTFWLEDLKRRDHLGVQEKVGTVLLF